MKTVTTNITSITRLAALRKLAVTGRVISTDQEEKIFNLLMSVVKDKTPATTLRVAGGWVRDKLLGLESDDIDIAIDNMSGKAFASLIEEWMREHRMTPPKTTIMEARPEQSKHLETAMLKIFGVEIDFTNLRSEEYTNTRIPTIKPGTPQEDAERRDLTINSLFYNINTRKIEDFTGTGVADLTSGIIRTPADPVETFVDDPLRILRAVRFAAKFNFALAPELVEAARNPRVQAAFRDRISKERIWKEMIGTKKKDDSWKRGFLSGPNPQRAAELLAEVGLRDVVLSPQEIEHEQLGLTEGAVPWETDQESPHHDLNIWSHTLAVLERLVTKETTKEQESNAEEYVVRNLSALLHDIGKRDLKYRKYNPEKGHYTYIKHEDSSAKIAEHILTQLKAPKEIVSRVVNLVSNHMRLHSMVNQPKDVTDKALRKFVKDLKSDWRSAIDLAIADAYGKTTAKNDPAIKEKYTKIRDRIEDLLRATRGQTTISRPVTGHDIMHALGLSGGGPQVGKALAALDEQLLETPNMTKEEAIAFIKSLKFS